MNSSSNALPAKQQQKQDAILHAALTLFAQRGFHGAAVPDVAKLADVGTGTIYRYFESKEELVNAVFQRAKSLLRDTLMQDGFDFTRPARQLFHDFWQRLSTFADHYPLEFRFLELQDHVPYLDDASRQIELQVLLPIWQFCVEARDKGTARAMEPGALMALIWGAFVGLRKAEYNGYLALDETVRQRAEEACWSMFAG
jgi:AcrR family transcriptional regulator